MELIVEFDPEKMRVAEQVIFGIRGDIRKVAAAAVNDTAKQVKVEISKKIRDRVAIKKKDIDAYITISRANVQHVACGIRLSESKRLPLKYFGARQTKQGVTYRIDKSGGRKLLPGAFGPNIRRLGNQVFKREGAAAKKWTGPGRRPHLPIVLRFGPSPWGVFVIAGLTDSTLRFAADKLNANLDRRVNFELLKSRGEI